MNEHIFKKAPQGFKVKLGKYLIMRIPSLEIPLVKRLASTSSGRLNFCSKLSLIKTIINIFLI
jgi:hypothetical protein